MVEHEIEHFYLIICLKLAVLTFQDQITMGTKILQPYTTVWQVFEFHKSVRGQIIRTDFFFRRLEIRIAFVFNVLQLIPMGIAEIAGYGVKGAGVG